MTFYFDIDSRREDKNYNTQYIEPNYNQRKVEKIYESENEENNRNNVYGGGGANVNTGSFLGGNRRC